MRLEHKKLHGPQMKFYIHVNGYKNHHNSVDNSPHSILSNLAASTFQQNRIWREITSSRDYQIP